MTFAGIGDFRWGDDLRNKGARKRGEVPTQLLKYLPMGRQQGSGVSGNLGEIDLVCNLKLVSGISEISVRKDATYNFINDQP